MSAPRINRFLLEHDLRLVTNPCVSPDFCLDWPALQERLRTGGCREYQKSGFTTPAGDWSLAEDPLTGDTAWLLRRAGADDPGLSGELPLPDGRCAYPASWENLLRLKNIVQKADSGSTIFPTAVAPLGRRSLGVGARFTTLHWPAVEWAMSALELSLTANQNSIPRELVYDVGAMLDGQLDVVPFPFLGTSVPEGHQGQSVEGMSHGAVLSKLKTGFHRRRLPWSFNADHQPIGGKFDAREDQLVRGCLLASYITFDLSPALAEPAPATDEIPREVRAKVEARLGKLGLKLAGGALADRLSQVWPAVVKMKRRDEKYAAARRTAFHTPAGREYLRELSIDELPGLTAPETTAVMLATCEALDLRIHYVAPGFGFQKNSPYPDNTTLRTLVDQQWSVCREFDVSLGFHSGSGKSAENYRVLGEVTGGRLEIKTSGRYTYEMGRALASSSDPEDRQLWEDWYGFTLEMALQGAYSRDETEQAMARSFIRDALARSARPVDVFSEPAATREALAALPESPEHMFWFEYNFLYVLAAEGRPEKSALGDHSPAGYRQRARFYRISEGARLGYARNVAEYLIFLAETTGLVPADRAAAARRLLAGYGSLEHMLADISR